MYKHMAAAAGFMVLGVLGVGGAAAMTSGAELDATRRETRAADPAPARSARFRARARHRPDRRSGGAHVGRGDGQAQAKRRGDVNAVVPDAEFRSYYGRAVLKPPMWTHDIAYYLFTGGLAAGSSMLAAVATARGDVAGPARRCGSPRWAAVGASAYFLIIDLGRPERFYNMLRVAKPTSPMSVGTWILTGYGPLAGAAAVFEAAPSCCRSGALLGLVAQDRRARWGTSLGAGAALTAPLLATYTAVLFADTAVPSWHEPFRELPFVFGGSALAAGPGAATGARPGGPDRSRRARRGHRCHRGTRCRAPDGDRARARQRTLPPRAARGRSSRPPGHSPPSEPSARCWGAGPGWSPPRRVRACWPGRS